MTDRVTRDNHSVPQMYLKRWSNNGSTLFCYDTIVASDYQPKWKSVFIKYTSYWRDFYTQINEGLIDDSIEKKFGREYETPAESPLDKVDQGLALDAKEMLSLVNFAILQMVRTPAWYAFVCGKAAELFDGVATRAVDKVVEACELGQLPPDDESCKRAQNTKRSPYPDLNLDVNYDASKHEIVSSLRIDRELYLAQIGSILNGQVADVMRSHNWSVISMPEDVSLPTSDNPFVKLAEAADGGLTLNGGVGAPGTLLFMPLTPRHLLATVVGEAAIDPTTFVDSHWLTEIIVRAIVQNATRYVYAKGKRDDIVRMRQRRVDQELYESLKYNMSHWNEIHDRS